jgi:Ubiquitinol-cytochrome C reductase Fe-S subunit TAT signal
LRNEDQGANCRDFLFFATGAAGAVGVAVPEYAFLTSAKVKIG